MKKYLIPALALLMLPAAAAPAAAQNKEHMQMEAELRMVQEQNQQLSLAFQQAMEAIKALNGRLDASDKALQQRFADLQQKLSDVSRDVSTVVEHSSDTDTRLRALRDDIKTLQTNVTALGNALAQGAAGAPAAPTDPNLSGGPTTTPIPPTGSITLPPTFGLDPNKQLAQARTDYYNANFTTAIDGFGKLIAQFPDTEAAAEAQYWMGESYFQLKKMPEALSAFNQVLQKSPRATYANQAAYKIGEAQRAMGDLVAARQSYEAAIKQYPNSDGAYQSQQRLSGMAAQNAPAKR